LPLAPPPPRYTYGSRTVADDVQPLRLQTKVRVLLTVLSQRKDVFMSPHIARDLEVREAVRTALFRNKWIRKNV
jgi:hypothetical protein